VAWPAIIAVCTGLGLVPADCRPVSAWLRYPLSMPLPSRSPIAPDQVTVPGSRLSVTVWRSIAPVETQQWREGLRGRSRHPREERQHDWNLERNATKFGGSHMAGPFPAIKCYYLMIAQKGLLGVRGSSLSVPAFFRHSCFRLTAAGSRLCSRTLPRGRCPRLWPSARLSAWRRWLPARYTGQCHSRCQPLLG
jgi:hypothetical protein